jgi:RNA polymerase sigma-70 factor (ECF subfamily)
VTSRAELDAGILPERSISPDATSIHMSDDVALPGALPVAPDSVPAADVRTPESFAKIYERYANFVWLSLQRLGVRKSDRQDLCHDVFVVAYKKLPSYTERSAIQRWLFAISLRLASNYRRKAYLRLERSVDSDEGEVPSPAIPEFAWPEASAARREAFTRARAILTRMQPLQRVVFVMFEVEGFGCDQIAAELGVPLGTVYSRLHTARKMFQAEAQSWAPRSKGTTR